MKKDDALRIIINSFNIYKQEYANKYVLFVYENKNGEIKGFEFFFKEGNFKHLTGVISKDKGENFYEILKRHQLSLTDFEFAPDGTTVQKLSVIEMLKDILYKPYLIGYAKHSLLKNDSKKIDVATGNSKKLTLGFNLEASCPVTLLKINPKEATSEHYSVLFTLRKENEEDKYGELLFQKENISNKKLRKIEKKYQLKINYSDIFKEKEETINKNQV